MNKQEAIKKLESIKVIGNDAIAACYNESINAGITLMKKIDESQITDEQAWNKIAESYPESAQSLRNTLDNVVFGKAGEPQKLILPKCAEQWIEGHCAPSDVVNLFIEVTCATDSDGFIDSKWRWSTDFYEWLANDADTLYILCDALRYGYEVEKEPLYHVKLKIPGATYYLIQTFLMPGDTHMCFSAATERYGAKWKNTFTESEIKAIDERYWAFAVPVEEAVEG